MDTEKRGRGLTRHSNASFLSPAARREKCLLAFFDEIG